MAKPGRPGAAKGKKGAVKGSGGNNKRRLEGKGPTPKAEDRKNHKAFKAKELRARSEAKHGKPLRSGSAATTTGGRAAARPAAGRPAAVGRPGAARPAGRTYAVGRPGAAEVRTPRPTSRSANKTAGKGVKPVARKGEFLAPSARTAGNAGAAKRSGARVTKADSASEVLSGRNSVLEALRAKVPSKALYIAQRIEMDDRVKESLLIANARGIPINEVTRPEIDRLTGFDSVHQGIALATPPYAYAHPQELLDTITGRGQTPLLVALDGITDPRNLGAIIRSVAAFGGQGVILPQRRSTGVTAAAWKTSAGAAARIPVALAANLTNTLKEFKKRGLFVVGLDGDGDMDLHDFKLASEPLVIVIGSEGKGLSRLVQENCHAVVSIPISAATESLNAGIAASVALYEISKRRAKL